MRLMVSAQVDAVIVTIYRNANISLQSWLYGGEEIRAAGDQLNNRHNTHMQPQSHKILSTILQWNYGF